MLYYTVTIREERREQFKMYTRKSKRKTHIRTTEVKLVCTKTYSSTARDTELYQNHALLLLLQSV